MIHNDVEKAKEKKTHYKELAEELGKAISDLNKFKTNLDKSHALLLKLDQPSTPISLAQVDRELEKVTQNLKVFKDAKSKIENKDGGLLKIIEDAQTKKYIMLENGENYSILSRDKNKRASITGSAISSDAYIQGMESPYTQKKTEFIALEKDSHNKIELEEFFKSYPAQADVGSDESRIVFDNDKKHPKSYSKAFPTDEEARWDHAFRWAKKYVERRDSTDTKPIYLIQGKNNPEEVHYLKEALKQVLQWNKEKTLEDNPEAKISANYSKIDVTAQKQGFFESMASGFTSLKNMGTRDKVAEIFKNEFQENRELVEVSADKKHDFKKQLKALKSDCLEYETISESSEESSSEESSMKILL